MACTLQVVWDEQPAAYNFGARHPMTPVRAGLTIKLARAFHLFTEPEGPVGRPAPATDGQLESGHHHRAHPA
jgi:acetoin utilization protein AcuC